MTQLPDLETRFAEIEKGLAVIEWMLGVAIAGVALYRHESIRLTYRPVGVRMTLHGWA